LSLLKPLSRVTKPNISLELAVAAILDHGIEEITAALKERSPEETAKLIVAVGKVWEDEGEEG